MHPYFGETIVFATKHKKEELIADLFKDQLGVNIELAEVDTDLFGTFSGEVERNSSALTTAIAKAEAAIAATGANLGLASEGTISNDPLIPLLVSDIEIMVLIDKNRNLIISESFRSFEITHKTKLVEVGDGLERYLLEIDFPRQKLIAKPNQSIDSKRVIKGIDNLEQLESAILELTKESVDNKILLEPDFRAHNCPSRQLNIKQVAARLVDRILKLCAVCGSPGFGQISYEKGLNCSECGYLNPEAIRSEILSCVSCDHFMMGATLKSELEPAGCIWCNP